MAPQGDAAAPVPAQISKNRIVGGGEANMLGKVFEGGVVAGVPVVLRTTVTLGGGVKLTLGIDQSRRIIGEYSPRMPTTWSAISLAKRVSAGVTRLLAVAAARPGFVVTVWHLALPAASVSRSGAGPLKRPRKAAAVVVAR